MTEPRPTRIAAGPAPAPSHPQTARRHRPRAGTGHPLLRPFPLVVMTIAGFLIIFTLLMARLTAGANPVLGAVAGASAVSRPLGAGPATVTTRASGGGVAIPAVAQGAASQGTPVNAAGTLVTRASGAVGAHDD